MLPYLAVAIGGFIGACLRFGLGEYLGTWHGFPIATLLTNTVGSFFLAFFYTFTIERFPIHPHVRLGVGTGIVGAFTTFSTFSVETWELIMAREFLLAFTYVVLTFLLGLVFALFGFRVARYRMRTRLAHD